MAGKGEEKGKTRQKGEEETWEPCQGIGCKCDGHKVQGHGCEGTGSAAGHRGAGHTWGQEVHKIYAIPGSRVRWHMSTYVNRPKQKGVFVF